MGFRTFNPSKNSWNPEVYHATSEVDLAQQMSKLGECQAFFSETSPLDRATLLRFIREELLRNQESIQLSYQSESGLTPERFRIEWKRTLKSITLKTKPLSSERNVWVLGLFSYWDQVIFP